MDRVINWFEIPVVAFARAKRFYETIFEIEMPTRSLTIDGRAVEMAFFPNVSADGLSTGALVCGEGYKSSTVGALLYLHAGQDLTHVQNRVEKAGGTVVKPKHLISPDAGYAAIIMDTEGNRLALHSMR
jgi:predicted enzyme related to lactoylglutathione lyase